MAATLRHQASTSTTGSAHSPTSSASSQTTTPTSPHSLHAQAAVPRYASTHPYAAAVPQEARSTTSLSIHHPRPPTPPLYQPPARTSFSTYLKTWGNSEITSFLTLHRCGHYAGVFQKNDIDGKVLLDLDMANLKEMGVSKVGERVKLLGGIKDLRKRAARQVPTVIPRIELRLNGSSTLDHLDYSPRSPDIRLGGAGSTFTAPPDKSSRRLNTTRPPPLDLQPHLGARPLPQAYQNHPSQTLTPRPRITHSSSSSATVTPANSVPGPSRSNSTLRAPSRQESRRSPSPINDPAKFMDRPLPPAPAHSSAAEYANSITQQRHTEGRGLPSNPAPLRSLNAIRGEHRKQHSLGTPTRQTSPVKGKSSHLTGRPNTSGGPVHPFAANASREESVSSNGSSQHRRQPTGGYVVGSSGMLTSKSSVSETRSKKDGQLQSHPPLDEIRRQVVKFVMHEDGTTRTVNVSSCTSGVEILEKVLKKFGAWHWGRPMMSTDGESDEEGDVLQVDGWGVYADSDPEPDGEQIPSLSLTNSQTVVRGQLAWNLLVASRWKCHSRKGSHTTTQDQTAASQKHGGLLWRDSSSANVTYFTYVYDWTSIRLSSSYAGRQRLTHAESSGKEQKDEPSEYGFHHVWLGSTDARHSAFTFDVPIAFLWLVPRHQG